jgi:hypothetical protein
MAAHTLSANSRYARLHGGNIRPNFAAVAWLLIGLGAAAAAMGVWGAATMANLQSIATVTQNGVPDGIFEKIALGGSLTVLLGLTGLLLRHRRHKSA